MAVPTMILAFAALCSQAAATHVYVMLPLDLVKNDGNLKDEGRLAYELDKLKEANVAGIATDVWWGVTERTPKTYDFGAWKKLISMLKQRNLKAQFMASFHQCGGNVGDTCDIPIPSFVTSAGDVWYKDKNGHEDKEYISLFADNVTIGDRTPIQMYKDWLDAFASTFQEDLGQTIVDVQVGTGPAGELRYPSYQLSHWTFCGVGAFQAFDKNARASFAAAAQSAGKGKWNSPPTDAGDYNSKPGDARFFTDGYKSDYGKFFLDWYFGSLKAHGAAVMDAARAALGSEISITAKISGIHWWYKAPHHAAELTAGYYNNNGRNAYAEIADVFAARQVGFDFTCLEMRDSEQDSSCASGPEELVGQVQRAATRKGITFNGENALPRYDRTAFSKIESWKSTMHDFTYLRMCNDLLSGDNWNNFKNFVRSMHSGSFVV